jgi:O-antigen ligase
VTLKKTLAYLGVFTLMAGDAVRNTVSWAGWGAICGMLAGFMIFWLVRNKPIATIRQTPWPLTAFLALILLSTIWSNYQLVTFGVFFIQIVQTAFAIFLAAAFSWRELLKILSNTIRVILASSLLFELYAAVIVKGPVDAVFKMYEGKFPPSRDFYWCRGNLFNGGRIQGILGNSNILAYVAMLGIILFFVELTIRESNRWLSLVSLATSIAALADAWSMTVNFALGAVVLAAIVSIAAEGKDKETRHRYYRSAWWTIGGSALIVLAFRAQIFGLLGKSPDISGRTKIWKLVLGLIDQRPLQGWGWTSYWIPFLKPYNGLVKMHGVTYLQAHNAFLDVWLQLGVLGLGLFIGLIGYTFVPLWRLAVRHTSPLYLWPILVFVGLIVQNLTESRFLIEIGWVLLVLFAVKVRDPQDSLEPRVDDLKRARLLVGGLRQNRSQPRKDR